MQCMNYKYELVEAPPDLPTIVAQSPDQMVVLSRRKRTYQVRYGLQVTKFRTAAEAAIDFASCLVHSEECRGLQESYE